LFLSDKEFAVCKLVGVMAILEIKVKLYNLIFVINLLKKKKKSSTDLETLSIINILQNIQHF
jgi:hypothetical protein